MSDGIWENSSYMNKYWKNVDITDSNGKLCIAANTYDYNSGFSGKSNDEIKSFFARKIRSIISEEGLTWDKNSDEHSNYLDYSSGVTVKDACRVHDKLLNK